MFVVFWSLLFVTLDCAADAKLNHEDYNCYIWLKLYEVLKLYIW